MRISDWLDQASDYEKHEMFLELKRQGYGSEEAPKPGDKSSFVCDNCKGVREFVYTPYSDVVGWRCRVCGEERKR